MERDYNSVDSPLTVVVPGDIVARESRVARSMGGEVDVKASWIVGIAVASLGLSACGATATIHTAVASLGSTPDVQVHLTASISGPGTQKAQQVLNDLSVTMDYANPTGAALSQAKDQSNVDITVDAGTQTVAELREVSGNAYVLVNVSSLTSIPNVTIPSGELAALQLVLGGRWFELKKSFIEPYLPTTTATAAQTAKDQVAAKQILDSLSTLVNDTPYTTLPNGGFSQTGSLEKVVKAVMPAIESLEGTTNSAFSVPAVKGTYKITLTTSGSTATGASITITAPNGTQGNESVGLNIGVTHNNVAVSAPSGATVITKSLLKELLSQAS